jgi:hypothetical protein
MNTKILTAFKHFCPVKLEPVCCFFFLFSVPIGMCYEGKFWFSTKEMKCAALLTHFDNRKKLAFIQILDDTRPNNLDEMMNELNRDMTFESLKENTVVLKNQIFCTKNVKDGYWYRVRVLNFETDKKVSFSVSTTAFVYILQRLWYRFKRNDSLKFYKNFFFGCENFTF